jgi:hypothetical protein
MTTVPPQQSRSPRAATNEMTRRLLVCGVIAGPLFIGASFIQAMTRHGFELIRQPLSLLLLGDLGWIQLINFEVSGLLAIAFAVGMRRLLHPGPAGTWGPLFMGAWGAGLIVAGIFGPDPSMGFPPGAPEGAPATMSAHSSVHGLGFLVSLASLIGACVVFTRRFLSLGQRGWAAYSVATAVAAPVLVALSGAMMTDGRGGIPLFGLGMVMSAWIALVAAHLLAE